jgi:ribosomal protein S18 acetylase RimI-like enzyme
MDSNFVIEKLTESNESILKVLNSLLRQLNPELTLMVESDLVEIIHSSCTNLFVLKDGDLIIGMVTLVVYKTPSGARGYVEDVVVDEKYRGKGLGKMLILHTLTISKEMKLEYVGLTSRPEKIAANNLYQSLGFKKRNTNAYRFIV